MALQNRKNSGLIRIKHRLLEDRAALPSTSLAFLLGPALLCVCMSKCKGSSSGRGPGNMGVA